MENLIDLESVKKILYHVFAEKTLEIFMINENQHKKLDDWIAYTYKLNRGYTNQDFLKYCEEFLKEKMFLIKNNKINSEINCYKKFGLKDGCIQVVRSLL